MNLTGTPANSPPSPSSGEADQPDRLPDATKDEVLFAPEVMRRIIRGVEVAVRAAHLPEERDDCVQEALLRLSQGAPEPEWSFFARGLLKRGKSLDSPKRRWLGRPVDSEEAGMRDSEAPELRTDIDPARDASAKDLCEQIAARLTRRERVVFYLLLAGHRTREIALALRTSHSVISRASARIRSLASQIGLPPIKQRR